MSVIFIPEKVDDRIVLVNCKSLGFKTRKDWYYGYYLKSNHYKNLRSNSWKLWLEMIEPRCITCGKSTLKLHNTQKLQLHHNNYDCLWQEVLFKDVIFVCGKCHCLLHEVVNDIDKTKIALGNYNQCPINYDEIVNRYNKPKEKIIELSNIKGGEINQFIKELFN